MCRLVFLLTVDEGVMVLLLPAGSWYRIVVRRWSVGARGGGEDECQLSIDSMRMMECSAVANGRTLFFFMSSARAGPQPSMPIDRR